MYESPIIIHFVKSKLCSLEACKNIPTPGFLNFEPKSGDLILISLNNDFKHSILISINKIEILDAYNPKIEKEDFEVIDLRG